MQNTKSDERGFASIVIALVLIIVLALFTVGFAQLARREQQTALDKQKAIQAQYAAESGINNAYQDILSGQINNANASDTNCMKTGGGPNNLSAALSLTAKGAQINTPNGVSYSCVLVALLTDNLQIGNLSPGSGRHATFGTASPLNTLTVVWGSNSGRNGTFAPALADASNPTFLTNDSWTYPSVVEISITPVGSLPALNPDKYLLNNTFTFYVYPSSPGSLANSVAYNPSQTGQVVPGNCDMTRDKTYPCMVQLTGLSGQQFVLHVVDFYDTANILMCGNTASCPSSSGTKFTGEPMIDVTGKARDVLKRLRVRLFTNGSNGPNDTSILPNSAIEAQNMCKRIQTAPQGSTYDTPAGAMGCDLSQFP